MFLQGAKVATSHQHSGEYRSQPPSSSCLRKEEGTSFPPDPSVRRKGNSFLLYDGVGPHCGQTRKKTLISPWSVTILTPVDTYPEITSAMAMVGIQNMVNATMNQPSTRVHSVYSQPGAVGTSYVTDLKTITPCK